MGKIIHKAETRGHINHGWLDANHSFNFGHFQHPDRNGFGALLVLNDDIIAPESGFGMHPHRDMEIITIPLSGALTHKDSTGSEGTIDYGMVQVMSAGKGVLHSETNEDDTEAVNTLQIWITPKESGIKPRYAEKEFDIDERKNKLQELVGPASGALKIHQDARINIIDLDAGNSFDYQNEYRGNGDYVFVIEGDLQIEGESLGAKDAIGLTEIENFNASTNNGALALILEVPMEK